MGAPLLEPFEFFQSLPFYEEKPQHFKHLNDFWAVAIYLTRQYFRTSLFSLRNSAKIQYNVIYCWMCMESNIVLLPGN